MANFFGTNINVITGFEVSDGKPIDPRYVVEKNTDLDSAIAFKYAGLITFVKEDGKFHYYNGSAWALLSAAGAKGEKGDQGTLWYKIASGNAGDNAPEGARQNDYVLDTGDWDVFIVNASKKLEKVGNIKGAKGDQGVQGIRGLGVYSGTAITGTNAEGVVVAGSGLTGSMVGDLYFNTNTSNIYKCTLAGNADTAKWAYVGSAKGIQGIQGVKGDKGDPFTIAKTYASVSAMNADVSNPEVKDGSFVMIASTVEDPDNAKLYVKSGSKFTFITDLSGAQGIKGEKGNTGDRGPQGDQGIQGPVGPQGVRGSRITTGTAITGTDTTGQIFASSGITDALVNDTYINTATGNVYSCILAGAAAVAKWKYTGNIKGVKGDQGIQGIQGIRGTKTFTGNKVTGNNTDGTVFAGSGVTDALVNDVYINTENGNVYSCTLGGNAATAKWAYSGNIKGVKGDQGIQGIQGIRGLSMFSGTAITGTNAEGQIFANSGITDAMVGDLYYNTATCFIYKCTVKGTAAAAKWAYVGSAKGAKGDQGIQGVRGARTTSGNKITGKATEGTVFPNSGITDALVGDVYINSTTGDLYNCTLAGAAATAKWAYSGNIKGVKGDKGDPGDKVKVGETLSGAKECTLFFKVVATRS